MTGSWRTTMCAVIGAGAGGVAAANIDPLVTKIAVAIATFATSAGLFFARDNKVTSEQVNAVKDPPRLGASLWLMGPLLGALAVSAGCVNPELAAYKVTSGVVVTVDGAMNAWGDYVRSGRASDGDQAKVRAAYEKYQLALRIEEDGITTYLATKDTNSLAKVMGIARIAGSDVLAVIESLLPPDRVAKMKGGG